MSKLSKHVVAKRPAIKRKRKSPRSPKDIYLEKNLKKIKFKNPVTNRQNSLWSYRIESPKSLKKMDSKQRKVHKKMHEKFKRERAKLLKRWRKKHGVKKKDLERASALPRHLLKRHKLLEKQYGSETIDMGNGPQKVSKLLKNAKGPAEFRKVIEEVDKLHKKERRRLYRKYGDTEAVMPDGSKKPFKEAIREAVDNGDKKTYKRLMNAAKAYDTADKKDKAMPPKKLKEVASEVADKAKAAVTEATKAIKEGVEKGDQWAKDVKDKWVEHAKEWKDDMPTAAAGKPVKGVGPLGFLARMLSSVVSMLSRAGRKTRDAVISTLKPKKIKLQPATASFLLTFE